STQTVVLRTFDVKTSQLQSIKPLLSGQRLSLLPTLDEEYVCLRDLAPSPDIQAKNENQLVQWSIFKVDGGSSVAEVPFEPGTTAAAVQGARIYFLLSRGLSSGRDGSLVVPRMVRAV